MDINQLQYTVGDFQVATLYEKRTGELQQSGTVALNTGYYDACVRETQICIYTQLSINNNLARV